jgi:hypothetical protein
VRFEGLTALSMKIAVFWDVTPCSLVDILERFGGTYVSVFMSETTMKINVMQCSPLDILVFFGGACLFHLHGRRLR